MRSAPSRPRRLAPLLAGAALAAGLALPTAAVGALRATDVTLSGNASVARAVVAVDGGTLSGLERQVDALDPSPADGRAVVRINAAGIRTTAGEATRDGVRVRVRGRPGNLVVLLDAAPGRFKFVSYRVPGSRDRLVIDLWRATTARAAQRLDDGCLRLVSWRGGAAPRVRGLELEPLFEHTVVTSLRAEGAGGSTISLRPRTAVGGVFLPDFSGYRTPGRWGGPLPHSLPAEQRAMLEAWSTSAKDGSLDCLVQVPVVLTP
ncbi:hypothetical protein [Miltoncostaea marina]|uniref:hypothetical protein n=1 Tax=Miltoncostaea marina TaxID=2843215 RepID=UPI001C3C3A64|nr:hypothetical protein [Miltoncostaea marina]